MYVIDPLGDVDPESEMGESISAVLLGLPIMAITSGVVALKRVPRPS